MKPVSQLTSPCYRYVGEGVPTDTGGIPLGSIYSDQTGGATYTLTTSGWSPGSDTPPIPLAYLDIDGTLAGNSDTKVASQKATKTYADTKLAASASQNAQLSGTAYTLTGSFAVIVGGTTSPTITIATGGAGYLTCNIATSLTAVALTALNVSLKLVRSNNIPASLCNARSAILVACISVGSPITVTGDGPSITIAKIPYTATAGDVLTLQAAYQNGILVGGTIAVTEAVIVWEPR